MQNVDGEMMNCYDECTKCKAEDCFIFRAYDIADYQKEDMLAISPLEAIFSDYLPYDYEFDWH